MNSATAQTQAVLFERDSRSARFGTRELPAPGPDDVLVESKVVGLCRSDIELLEGHLDAQLDVPYPVVPGHEWSGEVVAVGENVRHLEPGMPVVGECVLAPNHWFGFSYHGAAAEQFISPARLLHELPGSLSFEQGALVEPFTIAYRAIRDGGWLDAAEVVAIVGGGMVGQCALAIARAMGSITVVVEPSGNRRELAERMGAEFVVDPAAGPVAEQLTALTGRDGAGLVIEASGHPTGLASTVGLARHGGEIVNIGICTGDVSGPFGLIQAKDLTVRGTTGSPGVWPDALRFIERHGIDLTPVITDTYSFGEIEDALRAADDAAANVKVHLRPGA